MPLLLDEQPGVSGMMVVGDEQVSPRPGDDLDRIAPELVAFLVRLVLDIGLFRLDLAHPDGGLQGSEPGQIAGAVRLEIGVRLAASREGSGCVADGVGFGAVGLRIDDEDQRRQCKDHCGDRGRPAPALARRAHKTTTGVPFATRP